MSNVHGSLPLSVILQAKDEGETPGEKKREDWRKAKELEEARKAGQAPAEVDEEGKDINPHIPQYITQVPWYFGSQRPTLKHQRPQPEKHKEFNKISDWYNKGVSGSIATKYRKGACENCGAMTHKKKDCVERPRKVGARYTGDNFAPDEFVQPQLDFDYDGKRDRWNGYDPAEHKQIIEEYDKIEAAKRHLKAQKLEEDLLRGEGVDAGTAKVLLDDDEEDEDKYADDADMPGTKVDSKQRITVRNLRIREDVAKYLRNLDPNSAYYDPKTRAMRDNPYKHLGKDAAELDYMGDNFVRYTGDTAKMAKTQMFAWEAYEKGVDVHLLAEPTKLELLKKEYSVKKEEFEEGKKDSILEKYGGVEHMDAPSKQLLLAQTENYVEYSRSGKVIKGQEKAVTKSKYEEDVFINNHTSVWGSWWKNGEWGYKCCHSLVKLSYCTGSKGLEINEVGDGRIAIEEDSQADHEEEGQKSLVQIHQDKLEKKSRHKKKKKKKKDSSSSSDDEETTKEDKINKQKLKEALLKEEENKRKADLLLRMDERKRPYNSMYNVKAPTEEEMEAFQIKRTRSDDPMAQFLK